MAKNYDNYGYDDDYNNGRTSLIRKILIVLMIVIAIILIVVLIKGCSSSGKTKPADKIIPKFNYEEALLKAGKDYYSSNTDKQPGAAGECTIVELKKLMENNLVDKDKFGNCNQSTTFVKLCILEDGTKHYTPWLTCVDKNSENEYGALGEGSAKDVIANSTYVDFKFLPQEMKKGGDILGDVEEK